MFEYRRKGTGGKECRFFPHIRLKGEKPFKILDKDNTGEESDVWVLHCSTSTENVLYGGDMYGGVYQGTMFI